MDISAVAATALSGVWWRVIPAGGDPLHRLPEPPSNRWQRGEAVEGFYLADSRQTAWAEWYRFLAEQGLPPMHSLPRDLWCYTVTLERGADLRQPAHLAAVGLSAPRPSRADWPACQAVGLALFRNGWPALVAPSAARPTGQVPCVFRTEAAMPGLNPVAPPERVIEPPAPPRGMTT